MNRVATAGLMALAVLAGTPASALAQGAAPRIAACSVLPKEEVKKHLPWIAVLDQFPPEEETIGASGSSCNYPTVFIQVLPFNQGTMDAFRKLDAASAISGVGEVAFFRNNRNNYAELAVKAGPRIVTFQASADPSVEAVRPNVVNLARAFIAKLR